MSWRLLRASAVCLWLLGGLMFSLIFVAMANDLAWTGQAILSVCSVIGGYMFWSLSNKHKEQQELIDDVIDTELKEQFIMSYTKYSPLEGEELEEFSTWMNKTLVDYDEDEKL